MKLSELGANPNTRINLNRVFEIAAEVQALRRSPAAVAEPKPTPWKDRAVYAAALGSTSLVPSTPFDGVDCAIGRVWAEARSITVSGGTSPVEVTLTASKRGVRCAVKCAAGQTITGGSIRFWVFDPEVAEWALGGVDEPLPTGAQRVSSTDQFVTVGG